MKMIDFIETMKIHWTQYTGDPPDEIILPSSMYTVLKTEFKERIGDSIEGPQNIEGFCGVKITGAVDNRSMIVVARGREAVIDIQGRDFVEIHGSSAGGERHLPEL